METLTSLLDTAQRDVYGPAFGGFEEEFVNFEKAQIAILPVPYDRTSTYHKGADRGPLAILQASPHLEFYDIETKTEVYRQGIATLAPVHCEREPEELYQALEAIVADLLARGKFPVVLGGDHSISPGVVAGCKQHFPNLSVLQLDAHLDTRDSYMGSRYNHACVMARIAELCPTTAVGIRSLDGSEVSALNADRVFFAHDILGPHANSNWINDVVEQLSEEVYLTIDLDCFDPALMPSTGTPEPGGFDWYGVVNLLREVSKKRRVVGFDIVELLPRESNPAPDFLAAKLVYQFLSYIFAER